MQAIHRRESSGNRDDSNYSFSLFPNTTYDLRDSARTKKYITGIVISRITRRCRAKCKMNRYMRVDFVYAFTRIYSRVYRMCVRCLDWTRAENDPSSLLAALAVLSSVHVYKRR